MKQTLLRFLNEAVCLVNISEGNLSNCVNVITQSSDPFK